MICDIAELRDGQLLQARVGIVGAGFAGLELASCLHRRGIRFVLIESGRRRFDPRTQDLCRFTSRGKPIRQPSPDSAFTPYLDPMYRGECRIRQFGGTSNIWTGKWRAFDELDFAHRPWVPMSGWPITRDELVPYYRQIARDYGLADFERFSKSPRVQQARAHLAEHGLKLSFHYWQKTAERPAERFWRDLEQSAVGTVVLGANATEIVQPRGCKQVQSIHFKSLDGRSFTLQADHFVLCTGGLEGARLLLASARHRTRGIGNARGLVGRCYMDHPKTKRARLLPAANMPLPAEWTRKWPRPVFHVSLSLSDEMQQRLGVMDHAVYLSPVYAYQVDYPAQQIARLRHALGAGQLMEAARWAWWLARRPRTLWKLLQRRRYGDVGGPVAHYQVSFYVEQAPNRESALYLSDEQDALGMPRLEVNWQLCPLDEQSLQAVVGHLTVAFERAGLGRLVFEPITLDDMVDAAHHIGATRMAATPSRGVVDRDCRVFGTQNLFIASSSVFPTGHSAAPTMTILALSRRLGEHLCRLLDKAKKPAAGAKPPRRKRRRMPAVKRAA